MYKIVINEGDKTTIFKTREYNSDNGFINFIDKFGNKVILNMNNVVKIVELSEDE